MYDFKTLRVWQRALDLTVAIERELSSSRRKRSPGLAAQLARASASIGANIAEGAGYDSPLQSVRFLDTAIGSASEVENHLALASATGVIKGDAAANFTAEIQVIRRMLTGFRKWILRDR